jgi:hypothetical protein
MLKLVSSASIFFFNLAHLHDAPRTPPGQSVDSATESISRFVRGVERVDQCECIGWMLGMGRAEVVGGDDGTGCWLWDGRWRRWHGEEGEEGVNLM